MEKNKPENTSHYELLYIISNKFSEEELEPINKQVKAMIENRGGHTTYFEEWGKKKMAYPIKNFNYGYYFLYEFNAPREKIAKISKDLLLSNEVLRFQLVSKEFKTAEEIKKEKDLSREIAQRKAQNQEMKEKLDEEKAKGKVSLKDLDEKLDKILETDDLL